MNFCQGTRHDRGLPCCQYNHAGFKGREVHGLRQYGHETAIRPLPAHDSVEGSNLSKEPDPFECLESAKTRRL